MKQKLILIVLFIFLHLRTFNEKVYKHTISNIKLIKTHLNINFDYLGVKYVYGGTSTKTGLDCSALIQQIYKDNKLNIPRTTKQQILIGKEIQLKQIKQGDLLFFTGRSIPTHINTNKVGHVAIYIGDNKIMHATSKGVIIDSIGNKHWIYYYKKRLITIKRINLYNS